MPKLITIIGQKGVGKTTLFRQIIKRYSIDDDSKSISPVINYAEKKIIIENKIYKLVDTPTFVFSPQTEIEKGIKNQGD